ncbi:MAG: SAF domain-containing protein, partial [Pseudomonadota bacterium]
GKEAESRALRRSLFVVQDMRAGEPFTEDNVRSIRPGAGLHPRYLEVVLGLCAVRDIDRGTPIGWNIVSGTP